GEHGAVALGPHCPRGAVGAPGGLTGGAVGPGRGGGDAAVGVPLALGGGGGVPVIIVTAAMGGAVGVRVGRGGTFLTQAVRHLARRDMGRAAGADVWQIIDRDPARTDGRLARTAGGCDRLTAADGTVAIGS